MSEVVNYSSQRRLPDPYDHTRNDPCYLMSSNDVVRLIKSFYKEQFTFTGAEKVTDGSGKEIVTDDLLSPVLVKAKEMGWDEIKLVGKQLLFINNI